MAKHIDPPKFEKARKLTLLELNQYRVSINTTVITPELLEKMGSKDDKPG